MAPLVQPDFSEAVERTEIPPGTYKVRITGCEMKQTKAGDPRLNWKLTTFGHDNPKLNSQTIFFGTMIAGRGAGFLKQLLKAATGEDVAGSFDTDQILGREVQVTVVQGRDAEGNPSQYPEVKSVTALAR